MLYFDSQRSELRAGINVGLRIRDKERHVICIAI
jgi:hypothetical protein